MAKLVFTDKNFAGRVYELLLEKTTVGRGDHNTLVIHDNSLSSSHCEILMHGSEIIVRDLDSLPDLVVQHPEHVVGGPAAEVALDREHLLEAAWRRGLGGRREGRVVLRVCEPPLDVVADAERPLRGDRLGADRWVRRESRPPRPRENSPEMTDRESIQRAAASSPSSARPMPANRRS